jgi:hypothetical protein
LGAGPTLIDRPCSVYQRPIVGNAFADGNAMKKISPASPLVELPTEFSVVGEHRFDSDRLLLLDTEGHYFELRLEDGSVSPTNLGAEWLVDHSRSPYHAA